MVSLRIRYTLNPYPKPQNLLLHRLPEVIRIEEPREFWVNINNMDIALLIVPDHHFIMIPGVVCFDIDAKRSVDLEL